MVKKARNVSKAVEEVNTIPMLGFIIDIVDVEIADPDPIKISVLIINTFFFSNLYSSSYKSHYEFWVFLNLFSRSCFSGLHFKSLISLSLVLIFNNCVSFFKLGYVLIY